MDWQATGTSSFMQKEILTNKLRAFSEFAMGNPVTAQLIDARELLQQTWDVMEIGRESPILKDEDGKAPDPKMQELQQQVQQMDAAIQKMSEELEEKEHQREIDRYNAKTNRLKVMGAAMTPEQVQALVIQTLQEALSQEPVWRSAGGQASPEDEQHTMPDGEMMPDAQMDEPEMMEEPPPEELEPIDQPPEAAFFTPNESPL